MSNDPDRDAPGGADGEPPAPAEAAEGTPAAEPAPARIEYDDEALARLAEALLFVSHRPMPVGQIARAARTTHAAVRRALRLLGERLSGHGIQLVEVAGAYQVRTIPECAAVVGRLLDVKPVRLSKAAIEALAVVAYRQPVTKPEIDEIRGVDSGSAVKLLLDRGLARILGKKDEPGRPLLYGTTPSFLELFGLASLRDLPSLKDFAELTEESRRALERDLFARAPDAAGIGDPGEIAGDDDWLRAPRRKWDDLVEVLGDDLGDLPEGVEIMADEDDAGGGEEEE